MTMRAPEITQRRIAMPALGSATLPTVRRRQASWLTGVQQVPRPQFEPKPWLIAPFRPTSLEQLQAGSAMLERMDNKYVVRETVLRQIVASLGEHFDILEIDGKRAFTYETCYFDDAKYSSYFEHHQGRRQRCKIRVRKYADVQSCFVEVKLKDKRGSTVKKRLDHPMDRYGVLDERAMAHVRNSYEALYGREFAAALRPVLEIVYQRVTLVAKAGGERMTIDSGLHFANADRSHSVDDGIFVLETKSPNGNGIADKILREVHQHPTRHCSKYCIGAATLQLVNKHNTFLPALRKVNVPVIRHANVVSREFGARVRELNHSAEYPRQEPVDAK